MPSLGQFGGKWPENSNFLFSNISLGIALAMLAIYSASDWQESTLCNITFNPSGRGGGINGDLLLKIT